jgi:hypothetical protein
MREEFGPDEGLCDVGHHESPRELPALSQVKAEGQPSVGADGSAVSRAEVVVYTLPALWNKLAGVNAKVRPLSIRNRRLVDLSVMKRRPVAVVQTFAAADVCCISFPAGCRCRAGNTFARNFRNVGGTSSLVKYHVWSAICCRGGDFYGWN